MLKLELGNVLHKLQINVVEKRWLTRISGLKIAIHWSPMQPKPECWQLDF